MNCSPTLTAKEFSDIHNAKCELNSILQSTEGVIHPKLQERLEKALEQINKGLANAYKLDEEAYEKKSAHYDKISEENGFTTIWSVYEVADLNAPFAGAATKLAYKDHWGKKEVVVPINGNTWVDLWRAAEAAIKQSGDTHHIFIEAFIPSNVTGVLVLSTGS
jgi:hypothetical protein